MSVRADDVTTNFPKTLLWLSIWLSSMLVLVAFLNALELNNSNSPSNELLLIEYTLLLIVILIGISNFFSTLFCLFCNQQDNLQTLITSFFIAVSALAIACLIDPHTLIYSSR